MDNKLNKIVETLKNEMFIDIVTMKQDQLKSLITGDKVQFTTVWNTMILDGLTKEEIDEIEKMNERKFEIVSDLIIRDSLKKMEKRNCNKFR